MQNRFSNRPYRNIVTQHARKSPPLIQFSSAKSPYESSFICLYSKSRPVCSLSHWKRKQKYFILNCSYLWRFMFAIVERCTLYNAHSVPHIQTFSQHCIALGSFPQKQFTRKLSHVNYNHDSGKPFGERPPKT